jgi:hypothetical protein
MAGNSDVELADVLTHPDDYVPEALEAARSELLKRNLTVETLAAKREEAIRSEMTYAARRRTSSNKRSVFFGVSIAVFGGVTAAILEVLQPTRSLAHFAETLTRIGISSAGVGLLFFVFNLKFLGRIAETASSLSEPTSSIESLRQAQNPDEAMRSTFLLSASLLCGGLAALLAGVLLQWI